MNEADLVEAVTSYMANAQVAGTNLLTFVFAYITAAYLVGDKLTRVQLWIVSVLYTASVCFSAIGIYGHMARARDYNNLLKDLHPERSTFLGEGNLVAFLIMLVAILASSYYFMWSVRHPKTE